MNLRDLEYFVATAELLHMGRAAQRCHVSQPTLSIQLAKLEDLLGVALFERTGRTLRLTAPGAALLPRASHIVSEASALRQAARSLQDPLSGEFRLGAFPTLAPYFLPHAVPQIALALPKLRLLLVEEKTPQLLAQLASGALDAALLALPIETPGLQSAVLFEEPFLLAVASSHPLAKRKSLRAEELQQEALLLLEDGHCLRDQALAVCDRIGAKEQSGFRATSLETLRQMVASGVGVTLMPECATIPSPHLRYIPFRGAPYARRIGLVWRHSSPRLALIDRLVATLASTTRA